MKDVSNQAKAGQTYTNFGRHRSENFVVNFAAVMVY